jgi:raffinose/stachyose/melibiose transport system permease protein
MTATALRGPEESATTVRPDPVPPTPARPARRRRQRPIGGRVGSTALWIYAIVALIPLLLMVANSFRTTSSLYSDPLGAPWPIKLDSYRKAWTEGHFGEYFKNSLLVTVGAVALSTTVSTMAAYALARCRSRIFTFLESVFISGLMLPIHLAILPIFYLLDGMGLVDSRLGLMLVYAASGVPFSIFVLTTFFRQLPPELEEAARIDGANSWQMFVRIMVPMVRPAVATVVVFRFVPIWNDFLFPLVLLRSREKYTVPVGLTTFFGEYATDWSSLFAGLVIATVPLIILFLVATKQIVAGLTAGMSK